MFGKFSAEHRFGCGLDGFVEGGHGGCEVTVGGLGYGQDVQQMGTRFILSRAALHGSDGFLNRFESGRGIAIELLWAGGHHPRGILQTACVVGIDLHPFLVGLGGLFPSSKGLAGVCEVRSGLARLRI